MIQEDLSELPVQLDETIASAHDVKIKFSNGVDAEA